ncbi:MAG: hypothetical protein Q8S39_08170 [Ignavibacteria bacterium]|nr:hypothetical protein [Ignavibacteria bacterium]
MIYQEQFDDKTEALQREKWSKSDVVNSCAGNFAVSFAVYFYALFLY